MGRVGTRGVDGEPPAAVGVQLPDHRVLGCQPGTLRNAHGDGAECVSKAASLPYISAVSMCRYPASSAALTAATVSFGSIGLHTGAGSAVVPGCVSTITVLV